MINKKYKYKLFGRFKGRKKKLNSDYNALDSFKIDNVKNFNKKKYNILDIGSGSGENALHLSKLHLNSEIITCEIFQDGNINLCSEIKLNNIKNISLYEGNVNEFLDTFDVNLMFDEIWILFPDPWPKVRHHKRRLLNKSFFKIMHNSLKKTGTLYLASDSTSYIRLITTLIYNSNNLFYWKNQNYEKWNYDLLDLPRTKFNRKALESNRNSMFFRLNKI